MINSETTLRSIALEQPATIRVFERFHLDYCCGGNRSLAEACAEKGIAVENVLIPLQEAVQGKQAAEAAPDPASLTGLIRHIVETHHAYIRAETPRLLFMARKVAGKHGPNHPEALVIDGNMAQLADELMSHMMKEESILFPYIEGLERARDGKGELPHACFGTVESPIRMMIMEHEGAAALLEEMRKATNGFTPWEGACPTSSGLYHGVAEFERDLHRHVHLENNLLFPRALELEKSVLAAQ
jgi:regulator of cell morphogenesis and NO signaling